MSNKDHPKMYQERVVELNYLNWLLDNDMGDRAKALEEAIKKSEQGGAFLYFKRASALCNDTDHKLALHCNPFINDDKFGGEHIEEHFSKNGSSSISNAFQGFVKKTSDTDVDVIEESDNSKKTTRAKKFAEVLTPLFLVDDMLDKLPEHVWSDPSLTWLDPCAGAGTYAVRIIARLMEGLKEHYVNPKNRYKHIINNMLYFTELQVDRAFLLTMLLDPIADKQININIYNGSFLEEGFDNHMHNVWELTGFDIVIGNPPYQILKPGYKRPKSIWNLFVDKGIDICTKYFSMVHPSTWRAFDGDFKPIQKKMLTAGDMLYLEMHSTDDGLKTFRKSTTYDFYVIDRSKDTHNFKTKLMDNTCSSIDLCLKDIEGIVSTCLAMAELDNLLAKGSDEKISLLADSKYHTQPPTRLKETPEKHIVYNKKSNVHKHPVAYTTVKSGDVNLWWSSVTNRGHYGISKVIFSNGGASTPYADLDGEYALSQFAYGIVDSKANLPKIKKALESEEFIALMKKAGGGQHRYPRRIIAEFRKDFWKDFI